MPSLHARGQVKARCSDASHPKQLDRWLNDYRLGDLWRMGELGANP